MIAIHAGRVLTPLRSISPAVVLVDGAKIAAVGPPDEVSIPAGAQVIDAADGIVVPGFPGLDETASWISPRASCHSITAFFPLAGGSTPELSAT